MVIPGGVREWKRVRLSLCVRKLLLHRLPAEPAVADARREGYLVVVKHQTVHHVGCSSLSGIDYRDIVDLTNL